MYYKSYSNDPRWINAKFGYCKECNVNVKNKRAFFYPKTKDIYCEKCGEINSRDFESCAFDEYVYNNQ